MLLLPENGCTLSPNSFMSQLTGSYGLYWLYWHLQALLALAGATGSYRRFWHLQALLALTGATGSCRCYWLLQALVVGWLGFALLSFTWMNSETIYMRNMECKWFLWTLNDSGINYSCESFLIFPVHGSVMHVQIYCCFRYGCQPTLLEWSDLYLYIFHDHSPTSMFLLPYGLCEWHLLVSCWPLVGLCWPIAWPLNSLLLAYSYLCLSVGILAIEVSWSWRNKMEIITAIAVDLCRCQWQVYSLMPYFGNCLSTCMW